MTKLIKSILKVFFMFMIINYLASNTVLGQDNDQPLEPIRFLPEVSDKHSIEYVGIGRDCNEWLSWPDLWFDINELAPEYNSDRLRVWSDNTEMQQFLWQPNNVPNAVNLNIDNSSLCFSAQEYFNYQLESNIYVWYQPPCADLNLQGVHLFEHDTCNGRWVSYSEPLSTNHFDFDPSPDPNDPRHPDPSSLYMGSGWSALLYDGNGHALCAHRSLWDLDVDYYPNSDIKIEGNLARLDVFQDITCGGQDPDEDGIINNHITPTPPPPSNTPIPTPTHTPRPPAPTSPPQSCTNPPPDQTVAYLFENENCVNDWAWHSGHPSDSANRSAKSAWMPNGQVLLLSEHNNGGEPTICLRSPVRNLADVSWDNRVEWAELRSSCPVITPTPTPAGSKHEARFYEEPNHQSHAFTLPDPGTYYPSNFGFVDQFRKFYSVDLCSDCSIELTNVRGDTICWGWDENNIGDHGDWPLVTTRIKFLHYNDCPPRKPKFSSPEEGSQFWEGDSINIIWRDNDDPTSMYFTVHVKRNGSIVAQIDQETTRSLTVSNMLVGSYTIQAYSCSNIKCSDWQTRTFTVRANPTATPTHTATPTATPTATKLSPPAAPYDLVFIDQALNRVTAAWRLPFDPSRTAIRVDEWRGYDGWVDVWHVNLNHVSQASISLPCGQTRTYRVVSVGSGGESHSNLVEVNSLACPLSSTPTPTPTIVAEFAKPILIQPAPNAVLSPGTIHFEWESVNQADEYAVEIWGSGGPYKSGRITSTNWSQTLPAGAFIWQVEAYCAQGCIERWSGWSTRSLTIEEMPAPTPIPNTTCSETPATAPELRGDLNEDGDVDVADYAILISVFNQEGCPGFHPADIDQNGIVNIVDYNILLSNMSADPNAQTATPQPTSISTPTDSADSSEPPTGRETPMPGVYIPYVVR